MPIPKPEKTKSAPRSSKKNKHDYASMMARAKVRRKKRAETRAKRLADIKAKRYGAEPPTEQRRRETRHAKFGDRPQPATTKV